MEVFFTVSVSRQCFLFFSFFQLDMRLFLERIVCLKSRKGGARIEYRRDNHTTARNGLFHLLFKWAFDGDKIKYD